MIYPELYKIFGNIEYEKTKELIKKTKEKSRQLGLIGIAPTLALTQVDIKTSCILAAISCSLISISKFKNEKQVELYSKEFLEIKKIYDKVIDDFYKMCQLYGFKNPIEIHALYEYALVKGYLSKTGKQKQESIEFDFENLLGAYVLTGKSVCRHIATMEKDIMNRCGIKSSILFVCKEIEYESEELKKIREKYGNHLIIITVKNGKVNYLDATQLRIYKMYHSPNLMDQYSSEMHICINENLYTGTKKEYKNIKKYIKLKNTTLENDFSLYTNTFNIIYDNKNILKEFYSENQKRYIEIDKKLKVLEKKR